MLATNAGTIGKFTSVLSPGLPPGSAQGSIFRVDAPGGQFEPDFGRNGSTGRLLSQLRAQGPRMLGPSAEANSTLGSSTTGTTAVTQAYPLSSQAESVGISFRPPADEPSVDCGLSLVAPSVSASDSPVSWVSDVCEAPTAASRPTRIPRTW